MRQDFLARPVASMSTSKLRREAHERERRRSTAARSTMGRMSRRARASCETLRRWVWVERESSSRKAAEERDGKGHDLLFRPFPHDVLERIPSNQMENYSSAFRAAEVVATMQNAHLEGELFIQGICSLELFIFVTPFFPNAKGSNGGRCVPDAASSGWNTIPPNRKFFIGTLDRRRLWHGRVADKRCHIDGGFALFAFQSAALLPNPP